MDSQKSVNLTKHEAAHYKLDDDEESSFIGRQIKKYMHNGSIYELVVICPTNPVYGVFKTLVVIACMISSIVYAY